jgi:hypothetical protein
MVKILFKSGRTVQTNYNWEQIKQALHQDDEDEEFVVEVITNDNKLEWGSFRKDCIEGYLGI